MGMDNFRPTQIKKHTADFDEISIYKYRPRATHYVKRHFDPTTLVVSVNTQVPLYRQVSFFVFWSVRHARRSHRWTELIDVCVIRRLSAQECAFGGSVDIERYLWITSQKSVWQPAVRQCVFLSCRFCHFLLVIVLLVYLVSNESLGVAGGR